jgi:hypothetical protein
MKAARHGLSCSETNKNGRRRVNAQGQALAPKSLRKERFLLSACSSAELNKLFGPDMVRSEL